MKIREKGNGNLSITQIRIYPIKSCKEQVVDSIKIQGGALIGDREYCLFDEKRNRTITHCNDPRIVLIKPSINFKTGEMIVEFKDSKEILRFIPPKNPKKTILVPFLNNRKIEMFDMGEEASDFFSKFFGYKVRLVKKKPKTRIVENEINDDFTSDYNIIQFREIGDRPLKLSKKIINDLPNLNNRCSVSLISEATIEELNNNSLKYPILPNLLRTNFIVKGCSKYEEDYWRSIKVNNIKLNYIRGIPRAYPNVDRKTGKIDHTPEKVFREKKGYKGQIPNVGCLLACYKGYANGTVKVGDKMEVINQVKNIFDHSLDNLNVTQDQKSALQHPSKVQDRLKRMIYRFLPVVPSICVIAYLMIFKPIEN